MANDTLRIETVEIAKKHKASWIQLGQHLFSIYKNKLFKDWGYQQFETYCQKELGIKDATASKWIKSYSFLEKEEPRIVRPDFTQEEAPPKIPDYEAVNVLRLAKNNKNIPTNEFAELRNDVLNEGKEVKEVREQVKKILATHAPKDTPELKEQKRNSVLKRLVGFLRSAKTQLEEEDLVPDYLLKQIDGLAGKLEDQLN
ncbi:MAG TPA: hypothetical protein PLL75_03640 [Candidatus Omnitrophota bacterium]|nr:hypothetical protein [Candidatus Omnitrophota bacterium]HPS36801.1 hypothetical protein [Candidatus Omnitrophota bacterium]